MGEESKLSTKRSATARSATKRGSREHVLDRLAEAAGKAVRRRTPALTLEDRDPDFIRAYLPSLMLLSNIYFRGQVRGLEHIPSQGPALLVGNHSGGNLTPDTIVFGQAFLTHFGVERPFYVLAHDAALLSPRLRFLRKAGALPASPESARMALEAGAALLVYPGGDWETHRPSWESASIDFAGRTGFVKLALSTGVPIVPIVSIGGQESAFFLSRGASLARLLRLDKLLRVKVLPINIGPPWGLNNGDIWGRVPLPAQITIQVLEPIHLRERFGPRASVTKIYANLVELMQQTLDRLAEERRGVLRPTRARSRL